MAQQDWAEWCSDVHGEFGFDFYTDSYKGTVRRQRTDTYQLVSWTGESELVRREASGIRRDPRGHYELFVPLNDTLHVGGDAADQAMNPGEMVLVPIDAPFYVAHRDDAAALSLLVPFERIEQRLGTVPKRGQRMLPSTGTSRLTRDLLVGLVRERESLSAMEFDTIVDRVVDLFCIAAVGDNAPPAGVGAPAVLEAVRRYVREHLTDPDLTVARMAREIGWSPRYVQAVLGQEGTTASDLIRTERLELARTRLASPAFADHSITDIANSVGYGSPSAFSSAFRGRFGGSPRDFRS
ncbi:helix-turn-helix domain-containing protein [Flexivirga oryzae]|uniref:AraC-like DNA-binding protein n=1 Tax=Flexivirga oryzae TaxID=1794944 RepID=A0A839N3W1_9MICO|nr:AraC-like DNA-binding protein [Flexivirga oryzae]